MFTRAIVRIPGGSFSKGLTTSGLGPPVLELALRQHQAYCRALEACGLSVTRLEADERHPDSTFVEDVAALTPRLAILTRPGAASRQGEVAGMRAALAPHFREMRTIEPPGTVDGGDICQAEDRFFIGVSERTNDEGARQLAALLRDQGFRPALIDIRGTRGILHLKSGIAYLGDGRMAVIKELADRPELATFEAVPVGPGEAYAANCVRVNRGIILAAGYPGFAGALERLGYPTIPVDVSEFRKMDGGLSCLSLRF